MNVLVLGAGGLLGSNLVAETGESGQPVAGTYHSTAPSFDIPLAQLDIRDGAAFQRVLHDHNPDVVINCAAMTDVDGCETQPDEAFAVNGRAPGELAATCSEHDVTFVHVSTDYVFNGEADSLYDEAAPTDPIQVYGESKLQAEHAVRESHTDPLVVRLSFVWGIHQTTNDLTGFPAWVRNRLTDGESTPLFTDQHVTPSRAGAAAGTILDLVRAGHSGLFHVASRSCVTPYDFGIALCERLDADETLIEAGQQTAVDRPASRPRYTCLDVRKVEGALARPQPTLAADLDAVSDLL